MDWDNPAASDARIPPEHENAVVLALADAIEMAIGGNPLRGRLFLIRRQRESMEEARKTQASWEKALEVRWEEAVARFTERYPPEP
jgi:hypothetical protein